MTGKRLCSVLLFVLMFLCAALVVGCQKSQTFSVTFDSRGGNGVQSQTVKSGECAIPPENPVLNGYEFGGWYIHGEERCYDFSSRAVDSDIVLVARWIYARRVVSFDSAGGSAVPAAVVDKGETLNEPDPPKNGYKIFVGWFKGSETEPYDFSRPVEESFVLTAKWRVVRVTVYFDSDGGEVVPAKSVERGELVAAPDAPEREGYDFAGWLDEEGELFCFDTAILSATVLRAKWRVKSFTVVFDAAGGTDVAPQTVETGSKAVEPESLRFGFVFIGWFESDGTSPFDFDRSVVSDIFLQARWRETDRFENLAGEWKGATQVEGAEVTYSLKINSGGAAALECNRTGTVVHDAAAKVCTKEEKFVVLFFRDVSGTSARIDFVFDGASLISERAVFGETIRLAKVPEPLFDPAELAGIWEGESNVEYFGEIMKVSYVLDITFDGKGTLTYIAGDFATELIVVSLSARENFLIVEYKYFADANESYTIAFRVDAEWIYADCGMFGEAVALTRKKTSADG